VRSVCRERLSFFAFSFRVAQLWSVRRRMRFLRKHFASLLLSVVIIVLFSRIWMMKGSIVWTGFITFQAENLRQTMKADFDVPTVVRSLNFYLIYYRSHIGSVREGMLLQIINRDREQVISSTVEFLKKRAGEDLGDDPQKWIAKFLNE
jgi:hypothetical protein